MPALREAHSLRGLAPARSRMPAYTAEAPDRGGLCRSCRRRDAHGHRHSKKAALGVPGRARIFRRAVHVRTVIVVGIRLPPDCNEPVSLQGCSNKIVLIV